MEVSIRETRLCVLVLAMLLSCGSESFAQANPQPSKGQAAANLIRPEYYTAADFFADSQTSQAATLFEAALSQSRTINNQRGIDSVPPMVRLGECFLEQCDIGMALERYDAALQISIASQRWMSLLKPLTGSIRPESRPRDLPWSANGRGTQMGAYTEAWPIALGSNDQLLETAAGQGVTGKMLAIDAMEILRCQAIALRRRYQLLGPLTKHNPMTAPLLKAFSANIAGPSDPIQTAMNVCHALAAIGAGESVTAVPLLTKNLTLANGLDHPLTAIALLALADLAVESNEIMAVEERAIEASVVAGRAGQMDHLYEAVEYLSAAGVANGHDVGIAKMLQQLVSWSAKKSRLVSIRSHVEIAKLAALVGDLDTATKQSTASTTLLLPKQVALPRAEAEVRYTQAKVAFLEGKVADGITNVFESVAFLRGSEKGMRSPALFQLDLLLQLAKSKAIPEPTIELLLGQLLRPPTAGHWRVHPLEQMDWLMVDKSEANNLLVDIQLRSRDDSEIAAALDDLKRKRYRRLNELESRVFDLQLLFHGDNRFVGNVAEFAMQRKQLPVVEQNVTKIQQLIAPLIANPKWDLRKWSEDETRRWENVVRLSATQESLLWSAAISPMPVMEAFPPRHSKEFLAKSLRPTDAVVVFTSFGTGMRGSLYVSGKWNSWEVPDAAGIESKITRLLGQLFAFKDRGGEPDERIESKELAQKIDLRNLLFPREVWAALMSAPRWIIVPDGSLWNLPIETLPLKDLPSSLPCISEHCITYSPTLGLVPFLLDAKPMTKSTRGVDVQVNDFFSTDASKAKDLREDIATKKYFVVEGAGRTSVAYPPSQYFKIASDRIGAYATTNWGTIGPVPTDANPNQSHIRFWGRLPWGTPATLLLPGVNAVTAPEPVPSAGTPPVKLQATGDEWLRLTLPLIAQGTRQLTISRWTVGGESTVSLMRSFEENQEDLSVSESWQRGVLTLWEAEFDCRNEPLFKGVTPKAENAISGRNPLLWSGYLRIGDSK